VLFISAEAGRVQRDLLLFCPAFRSPQRIGCATRRPSVSVLTDDDVEQFIELGYCTLPDAFTRAQADAACRCLWRRIEEKSEIRQADPATWPAVYDIEEHLRQPEVVESFSDRLAAAIEDLVGSGRWSGQRQWGLWPVNFSYGTDWAPGQLPQTGWHIDGNWFEHAINTPKQGLLIIGLFTDIEPGWGGTVMALGSHKRTAKVLSRHYRGISHRQLFKEVLAEPIGNFHQVTGAAGTAVLAHPFLFHNRGPKHGGPPRVISNTEASLNFPLELYRRDPAQYSVLERSIKLALRSTDPVPDDAMMFDF
jgi:Phytanoyl-CoA dioxygenase (PhyH)